MLQVKLAFELGIPTKNGVTYTGAFLEKLDLFIKESGITFIHKEDGKFTKTDFVGVVSGYELIKDRFIVLKVHEMNEKRFNALHNINGLLTGLPRVKGSVDENGIAQVEKIEAIEIIV